MRLKVRPRNGYWAVGVWFPDAPPIIWLWREPSMLKALSVAYEEVRRHRAHGFQVWSTVCPP